MTTHGHKIRVTAGSYELDDLGSIAVQLEDILEGYSGNEAPLQLTDLQKISSSLSLLKKPMERG